MTEFTEKQCGACREFWPADAEFFYLNKFTADGLQYRCKACCSENRTKAQESQKDAA